MCGLLIAVKITGNDIDLNCEDGKQCYHFLFVSFFFASFLRGNNLLPCMPQEQKQNLLKLDPFWKVALFKKTNRNSKNCLSILIYLSFFFFFF